MVTIEIESNGIESKLEAVANELGLSINKDDQQNFDAVVLWTIGGNAATVAMFLIKIYELCGKNIHLNYHSEKVEQDGLSIGNAIDIAKQEPQNG